MKVTLFMPAVAIALLASCSAEQANTPAPSPKETTRVYMEVTAARPVTTSATRTAYAEDGKTDAPGLTATWSTGDKLGVMPFNDDDNLFPSTDDYLVAQGDGGEATMTFAGTSTESTTGQYRFYHPLPDGPIGTIDGIGVTYYLTGQTCNLLDATAELGKRDVFYNEKPVNPANDPIQLVRVSAVLRFELKLPQGAGEIQRIELRSTKNSLPTTIELTNLGVDVRIGGGGKSGTLTLGVTGDKTDGSKRTIIAYMTTAYFVISTNDVITVRAIADDAVYSHTFALEDDLHINSGQVHTFAPEAELVKEKVTAWAGSNIYWDDKAMQLTFDPVGTTTHQFYQGVFFKWGSLVGISPALTANSQAWDDMTMLYLPLFDANNHWIHSFAREFPLGKGYNDIPYYEETDANLRGTDKNSLYDKQDLWKDYKGDICQYIGATNPALKGYRMPRAEEFGSDAEWKTRIDGDWEERPKLAKEDGTADFSEKGYATHKASGAIFPASGYRIFDGSLTQVGNDGDYWSSSADAPSYFGSMAYLLSFQYSDDMDTQYSVNVNSASPVRCVKDE
jgi:hypothetical protein